MKEYQFEEITASLSIIIVLLAYHFGVTWLFYIFLLKAVFDTYYLLRISYKQAKKEIEQEKLIK